MTTVPCIERRLSVETASYSISDQGTVEQGMLRPDVALVQLVLAFEHLIRYKRLNTPSCRTEPQVAQHTGKVVWFNNAKGFGFLSHEGGTDVFVHFSAILSDGYKALKEDDPVEFDVEAGTSGKVQAANVRVVRKAISNDATNHA